VGGLHSYLIDEFRSGILFVMLKYGFPSTVYAKLNFEMKNYTLSDGRTVSIPAPYDGGAFQMLWPLLTMPETMNPAMSQVLSNFVDIALDFSARNNLPGFLAACYSNASTYVGSVGIQGIAINTGINQAITSLYTLGAARMIDPARIDQFLKDIFAAHPDLVSAHGLWEGYNTSTGAVAQAQIMANVATFLLGVSGRGPEQMARYLQDKGLYASLQSVYDQSATSDIIASSVGAFSWEAAGVRSGSAFTVTSPNFNSELGIAFTRANANFYGKRIKLRYRSTTAVGVARIELKRLGENPPIYLKINSVLFANTGGEERELLFELPAALGLQEIDEFVMVFANGTGQALDMTITGLEVI
jgi:hypothetical protein